MMPPVTERYSTRAMSGTPLYPSKLSPKVSVLLYHRVGVAETRRPHYCDVRSFRAQMHGLKWTGFEVISLKEAFTGLFEDGPLPKRPVVISFDDGFQDFHDHAFPILQEFGYPSVVFVVAGLLGQPAKWLVDGSGDETIMAGSTLRALRSGQVDIGAHTISHPRLPDLSVAQQESEIRSSKSLLEDVLGEPVESFAYPFGRYDAAVRDAVGAAGYRMALTVNRGLANVAPNPYEIPRKAISWGDNAIGFFYKLLLDNKLKRRPRDA